jgi:prepilin-type processing-associated H-X9-DG protein
MHKSFAFLFAIGLAAPCVAGEPKFDAEARARVIAPYLAEGTIALARLAVTGLNADALTAKLIELTHRKADDLEPFKQETGRWIADFTKAGGKEIYIVFDLADLPGSPFGIVPLERKADGDAIAALLQGNIPWFPRDSAQKGTFEVVEKLDHAIFAGDRKALARIKENKPASRPEVAKAFAAIGDTAAQLLLLPTADARRVVEELMPALPNELGGGPTAILTNGLRWAALGLDSPPNAAMRFVVQSKDATAARALNDLFGVAVQKIGQLPDVRRMLPQYDKLAALISPAVKDDRIALTLDPTSPGLSDLLSVLTPRVMDQTYRIRCAHNLRAIILALHYYHDVHGHFPAVANFSNEGKALLSWRVHILPYLGQDHLYKQFHLDEPWDSEHNKKLIERMPEVFQCPSMSRKLLGKTTYVAPVGESMVFTGRQKGVEIKEITDGTSNTIMIVDADDTHAVIWTRPDDLQIDLKHPSAGLFGHHLGVCNVAFADGSVRFLPEKIEPEMVRALFTRNGGETITSPP